MPNNSRIWTYLQRHSKFSKLFFRPQSLKRADIQALRALAVLAVVIYHLYPTRLIGGFMGVDVFFVISGYLMTLTIWKGVSALNSSATKKFSGSVKFLLSFYARRIKRLMPAATACLLAVLIAVQVIGNFSLILDTTPQVFASAIFLQNWFLAGQAVDYLGADAGATAVQHFWSLSVEEQFYLIWPLLLLIVGLIGFAVYRRNIMRTTDHQSIQSQRVSGADQNWQPRALPLVVITAFTAVSFVYCLLFTSSNPTEAYFVTPARIWELSLGGVIVFLPKIKHRHLKSLLPYLSLLLIVFPFIFWDGTGFPGWHALLPTLGTALIIWAGCKDKSADNLSKSSIDSLAGFRPLQFFGDISYSLYLWHWPLIVLVPYVLGVNLNANNSILKLTILFASVIAAWLSYKLIEGLPNRLEKNSKRPTKVLAATWITGAVCLALILAPANMMQTHAQEMTDNILQIAYKRAMDPNDTGFGARATQHPDQYPNPYGQTDREWAQFGPSHYSGTVDQDADDFNYDSVTSATSSSSTVGEFGDISSSKTILFIGDSYSKQWYPAIDIAAKNLGYKVIAANSTTAGGGMFELENTVGDVWVSSRGIEISIKRSNDRFNWIKDNLWSRADIVLVGVSPTYFTLAGTTPENSPQAPKKLAQTFKDIWAVTGNKPILIQAVPVIADYDGQIQYINHQDKVSPNVEEYMNRTYVTMSQINALDCFEYLQIESLFLDNNKTAHTQIGGVPVYSNYNHINSLYAASAAEYFTEHLAEFIN